VRDQAALEPGLVDRARVRWQVGESGGFGVAGLSFGSAASAVERFGKSGVGVIGDEHLQWVALDLGEGEL
jgi:hypothetical protein